MMRLEAKDPLEGKTAHILPKRTRKPTPEVIAEIVFLVSREDLD
jgi:hypothetical protein